MTTKTMINDCSDSRGVGGLFSPIGLHSLNEFREEAIDDEAISFLLDAVSSPNEQESLQRGVDKNAACVSSSQRARVSRNGIQPMMSTYPNLSLDILKPWTWPHLDDEPMAAFSIPLREACSRTTMKSLHPFERLAMKTNARKENASHLSRVSLSPQSVNHHLDSIREKASISQAAATLASLRRGTPLSLDDASGANNDSGRACQCKRTKCLKLYCHCFASGVTCTDACLCKDCKNVDAHRGERAAAIELARSRKPGFVEAAFSARTEKGARMKHQSSQDTYCRCRKSKCLKKYCDCFKANRSCTTECDCRNCENQE